MQSWKNKQKWQKNTERRLGKQTRDVRQETRDMSKKSMEESDRHEQTKRLSSLKEVINFEIERTSEWQVATWFIWFIVQRSGIQQKYNAKRGEEKNWELQKGSRIGAFGRNTYYIHIYDTSEIVCRLPQMQYARFIWIVSSSQCYLNTLRQIWPNELQVSLDFKKFLEHFSTVWKWDFQLHATFE